MNYIHTQKMLSRLSTWRCFSREQAKSECDWVVMSSVFVASQSSCFFHCSREQIRLVESRLHTFKGQLFCAGTIHIYTISRQLMITGRSNMVCLEIFCFCNRIHLECGILISKKVATLVTLIVLWGLAYKMDYSWPVAINEKGHVLTV